jgi:hypothetical protein
MKMRGRLIGAVLAIWLPATACIAEDPLSTRSGEQARVSTKVLSKRMPGLSSLARDLLKALEVNEPVHINQTLTSGGPSEFDCESASSKVQAACRLACGVVQNFGCGCSTTENGCSCECHGID